MDPRKTAAPVSPKQAGASPPRAQSPVISSSGAELSLPVSLKLTGPGGALGLWLGAAVGASEAPRVTGPVHTCPVLMPLMAPWEPGRTSEREQPCTLGIPPLEHDTREWEPLQNKDRAASNCDPHGVIRAPLVPPQPPPPRSERERRPQRHPRFERTGSCSHGSPHS